MPTVTEGVLNASGKRFGILASRFNELITKKLLEGAIDDISIVWVPGAFEIPVIAKKMAKSGKHDAVICLGAVIRGNTPHFDYIAAEVSKGIASVGLEQEIPVIFGVLTTDSIDQAVERAGTKSGNKGWDAALTAIEMVDLIVKI
jgi:6,7-dimethyl-8-ribityllumazine synthase